MSSLIITENYLKKNSLVNENVDMKVITPIIHLVQDLKIHPILGSALYNEIEAQILASTPNTNDAVSAANVTLLDNYILPTMIWYIQSEATPAMKYKYMNKGIMIKNSENSTAADLQEIQYMFEYWRTKAESYAERCTKFLLDHISTYPLYVLNPLYSDIKPNSTNYSPGIFLEDWHTFQGRFRGEYDPTIRPGNGTSDIKNG